MSSPSSPGEHKWHQRLKSINLKVLILQLSLAMAVAAALTSTKLDFVEAYLYDFRIRLQPSPATSNHIALIAITPSTIEKFRGNPSLTDLQLVLNKIQSAKVIGLDDDLKEFEGPPPAQAAFSEYTQSLSNFFVLVNQIEMKGEEGQLTLEPPFERVPLFPAPKTSDLKIFAKDGVTRRMLVSYQDQPLFHTYAASLFNSDVKDIAKIRGTFEFAGSQQTYIQFRRPKSYPTYTFESVLAENFDASLLKEKIVLIGSDTAFTSQDYILTPYSREIQAMTTLEMHANMIDTLIFNKAPVVSSNALNFTLLFLISFLTIHVVLALAPLKGLLILISTLAGFSFVTYLALMFAGFWIKLAQPLIAIFLVYYFFIPYRLIIESRKSWEYYQKHKLLSQVEELKTNFISMMSHDLKTPIARIQGMLDMILRDPNTLSTTQRESVDTIKASADDLLKFINAILAYGRIESEGVQLHLQSKDVNKLLEEVIKKHEFLAKLKRIQIICELEPMFPIQLDPELMKQVFSNLIENAIKYSPEDTKILVSTEENGDRIIVQIADQGPGIPADEIPNIFMKFFRTKNHKSSPIKGSGLGLYLAKYFTEIHHGNIFVESTHGQGSTFTVELPIESGGKNA
ncbi:MAG: CHASE2 domain-containing protein [Bdellovibrionia bacterium]